MKPHACLPALLLTLPLQCLAAAEPVPPSTMATNPAGESKPPATDRERVAALRQQADLARQQAEARYQINQNVCYSKFLMNACLDEAKQARNAALIEARKPVAEAREIEHRLRQSEADESEARRLADAPRREREASEQAARNKAEQDEAMQRIERKQAEKARKAGAQ